MNIKNIVKKFTLVSLATLGIVASSNTVIAEEELQSAASIEFKNPEVGNVPPKDPENPANDLTDGDGSTNNKNPQSLLSLDYVTNLDFGEEIEVNQAGGIYNTVTQKPFVQVSDRRQTGEGWDLRVQLGKFAYGIGSETLVGSTINFKNARTQTPGPGTNAPTTSEVTLTAGGEAAQIASAAAKTRELSTAQGLGTWLIDWIKDGENDNVTLTVPANEASEGQHSATITWTLTSGPGQ